MQSVNPSPFSHSLSISSLSLRFLIVFSFSLHFLTARLVGWHNLRSLVCNYFHLWPDQNIRKRSSFETFFISSLIRTFKNDFLLKLFSSLAWSELEIRSRRTGLRGNGGRIAGFRIRVYLDTSHQLYHIIHLSLIIEYLNIDSISIYP